jgi:hypothetical protein
MPNEWINICAEITNLAELKVVQYVLRHTWGYHEYDGQPKPITIDEFMHGRKRKDGTRIDKGTGLSEMSVRNGLEKAIEHGYIICESDERDKARIKKSYKLNMLSSGVQDLDPKQKKSGVQDLGDGVQNLDLGTKKLRPRSEKETKEKHQKKNTEERKNDTPQQNSPVSTQQESSHSFIRSQNQSSLSPEQTKPEEKLEVVFSPEAAKVFQLAKELNLVALKGDKKDSDNCTTLAEKGFVTLEKIEELMEFCWKERPYLTKADGTRKSLCLQNLVTELPGWLQLQRKTTAAPSATVVTSTMGKNTQALFDAEEERKKRILEKEATQGGRRTPLQELVAAQKKQRALERTQQSSDVRS